MALTRIATTESRFHDRPQDGSNESSHPEALLDPPSRVETFPDWHRLDPLWQAATSVLGSEIPLTPAWQLLLLGDGYTTRHLQLLSGQPIQAEVLNEVRLSVDNTDPVPEGLHRLEKPTVRRQVRLVTASGDPLLYATSWWASETLELYLPDRSQPIGRSLSAVRTEVFREILGLEWGHSAPIATLLDQPGPFWGRHYLLWQRQRPITLIYEVFSPLLSRYLGDPVRPTPS